MPVEPGPRVRHSNYLEGLPVHPDDANLRPIRERLKTGGSYKKNDVMPIFDDQGIFRYVSAQAKDHEGRIHVWRTDPSTQFAIFHGGDTAVYEPAVLDRFTRGTRSDLAVLLQKINTELLGLTHHVGIGSLEDSPTMRLLNEFQPNIAKFYYSEPPDYQALFESLAAFAQIHTDRFQEQLGVQFKDIRTADDVLQVRQQLLGEDVADAATANLSTVHLLARYGQRLDLSTRALLALLDIKAQELGVDMLMPREIDE